MNMSALHLLAAASSASAAPEKEGGMPQISQLSENGFVSSQIFWLLIVFGLVYLVIGRMMAGKVVATVEQRDQTVADDLAGAEAARTAADAAEEQWRAQENARGNRRSASWPKPAQLDHRPPSSGSARPMPSSTRARPRQNSALRLHAARR
jgi:hypothetical protein